MEDESKAFDNCIRRAKSMAGKYMDKNSCKTEEFDLAMLLFKEELEKEK